MKRSPTRSAVRAALAVAVVLGLTGCFGPLAGRLADKETYPIIADKQRQALGEARTFTIDKVPDELTRETIASAARASDGFTTEGLKLGLRESLALAIRNNREYQTAKEQLYLSALNLTEARHELSPIFTGLITSEYSRDSSTNPVDGSAEPGRSGAVNAGLAMSWIFATGTQITLELANTFTKQFGAPPMETANGAVGGSIVQPLLRNNPLLNGAGFDGTLENLRQSERDVIYAVRDFARYERTFTVDRVEEYLRLLQQLDSLRNQEANYRSLKLSRERSDLLGKAGRLSTFQVDQARQAELRSETRLITLKANIVQAKDRYKMTLGLPVDLNFLPNEEELKVLVEKGLPPITMNLTEAIDLALKQRLDYQTVRQEAEDAERRMKIAENALLPDFDIVSRIDIPDDGKNQPFSFDTRRRMYNVRAALQIPLNRKIERNNYRQAMISLATELRREEQRHDEIIRDVRATYQDVLEAKAAYDVQVVSLKLASRRVDSTRLLLDAGRATVRDLLDSQDSYLTAQNALTAAMIDYTISRLRFLLAIEGLTIDDRGMWFEPGVVIPAGVPNLKSAGGGN